MMRLHSLVSILTTILIVACIDGPEVGTPMPMGNQERFEQEIQPVLSRGCGNPSCHGTSDRPLQLYSVFGFRLDPDEVYMDVPLSDEELLSNHRRVSSFLYGVDLAMKSPLLSKPLAPEEGGTRHAGGVIYMDPWEQDYLLILEWASDALNAAGE